MKNILLLALISLMVFGCSNQKPTQTIENLKKGIIGETTASAKYAAYAQQALDEGFTAVATLFTAASKAETIHAENHTKVLTDLGEKMDPITPEFDVKTTAENLQAAIDGESYEFTTMYPEFIKAAKDEGVEKAEKSFTWALDTEKKHKEFYATALEAVKANNQTNLPTGYAVCPVCGNTYDIANVDDKCNFCQTSKEKFFTF